jgi:hypothetical protein
VVVTGNDGCDEQAQSLAGKGADPHPRVVVAGNDGCNQKAVSCDFPTAAIMAAKVEEMRTDSFSPSPLPYPPKLVKPISASARLRQRH